MFLNELIKELLINRNRKKIQLKGKISFNYQKKKLNFFVSLYIAIILLPFYLLLKLDNTLNIVYYFFIVIYFFSESNANFLPFANASSKFPTI